MPDIFIGEWPSPIRKYYVVPWELDSDKGLYRHSSRRMSIEEMLDFDFVDALSDYIVKTQFWMFPRGVHEFVKEFTRNRFGVMTFCLFREQVPGLGMVTSIYNIRTDELIAQRIERI